MWMATLSFHLRAARMIAGRRSSSGEPRPHHELTTSPTPAAWMSRICARSTSGLALE
jgi:hypothetical protein